VREIAPEDCRLHQDWSSGIFVEMAVQDTGCGMGPAVLERVFEPFFTTKPVGSGTGLGLAVVRAIVRNHGGHVGIESEAGVGTTVMVRIPQSQPQVTARPEGPEVAPAAYANGGSGCILLVDDDREVLTYAQKVLQRAGYRVYPASNGMMAIDLFDQHQAELSLAIVDLTMPGPSGRDVIGHIRGRSQTVPIILCTGFAQGGLDNAIVQEVQGFLKKPFRQRDLLELVAEVIMG
jgi:CheY-like chemotaxis protein